MNTHAVPAEGWKTLSVAEYLSSVGGGIDPFSLIGKDWMLVGAGTAADWNAMTASWGGLGHLWNKNVAFCFVRPSRHTYGYVERADRFTLSFFAEEHRSALNWFGSRSGRDGDKAAGGGLSPISFVDGTVSFAEARLALSCRKLFAQKFDPASFVDAAVIAAAYPKGDFHTMYVGEIEAVRVPGHV